MPSAWEPERSDGGWSDREAWRGDLHLDGSESWGRGAEDEWGGTGDGPDPFEPDRGTRDTLDDDWPEDLAGPEYWLYKRFGM